LNGFEIVNMQGSGTFGLVLKVLFKSIPLAWIALNWVAAIFNVLTFKNMDVEDFAQETSTASLVVSPNAVPLLGCSVAPVIKLKKEEEKLPHVFGLKWATSPESPTCLLHNSTGA